MSVGVSGVCVLCLDLLSSHAVPLTVALQLLVVVLCYIPCCC